MRHLILYFTLLLPIIAFGQEEKIITGIVVDRDNLKPLAHAIMHTEKSRFAADETGRITARVKTGENVAFSHVGYQTARMEICDTMAYQTVFTVLMSADTVMLSEVIARAREIKLEQISRTMPVVPSLENAIANANVNNATYIAKTQAPATIDASGAQKREISSMVMKQEYEGMVAPGQMITVFSPAIILALIQKIKKADSSSVDGVKQIDSHEVEELLRNRTRE